MLGNGSKVVKNVTINMDVKKRKSAFKLAQL